MRTFAIALLCALVGTQPGMLRAAEAADAPMDPGSAWIAEYRLDDARGSRPVTMVRDAGRVEYRPQGEPVRQWRRLADGLELREVLAPSARVVVFTPGDLRALQHEPDWHTLQQWVSPEERRALRPSGQGRFRLATGERVATTRMRGERHGAPVRLEWLVDVDLPVRYRHGRGAQRVELQLLSLRRAPAAGAFTATVSFEEIDYADIGDREHDTSLQRYLHMGSHPGEHAH